ncbi:class I SAM-dependent methyltransferase [Rhodococcus sp. MEB064]|uniref:class I SAM-dependent methyltransferase n=1 Tax=Rhodococcus sp. MEB064 TaxID=1587522 RepID=UPI0005B6BE91|nr:class I SAM-dependent methyltransferase [Rhodococcus sp. MEB064]KIQ16801.1 hypothetical protein RU01_12780 [Rhodococcus sp. MEB064]
MVDTTAVVRTRTLLREGVDASTPLPGVLDVRGVRTTPDTPTSAAGRLMNFSPLATIYERAWRPLFRVWMGGPAGPTVEKELDYAVKDLGLTSGEVSVVLDLACGPGNFTRSIADVLRRSGVDDALVIGADASDPMIARASADTRDTDHIAYLLGDARSLPFDDGSIDAVCCYAALYLVPEPFRVLDEMIRVLRPGGRLALMATVRRGPSPVSALGAVAAGTVGLEMFERDAFTTVLERHGFVDIVHRVHGAAQFVAGRRPA